MSRVIRITAGLVVAALLAGCNTAGEELTCEGAVGVHGNLSEPADLGNGIVGQRASEAVTDFALDEVMRYTDCATGETVIVGLRHKTLSAEPLAGEDFDDTAKLAALRAGIAAMEGPVTLDRLRALAAERGMRIETGSFNDETCACRLFYPERRGSKTPFDAGSRW